MACSRCGTPLAEGWRFCPDCGLRARAPAELPFRRRRWWRVLVVGTLLYFATMAIVASSGSATLAPTAILLGAFLGPIAYVTYLYESHAVYDLPLSTVGLTFLSGGILGLLAAQLLEQQVVLSLSLLSALGVAFSEEVAKMLGVLWLLRRAESRLARHGFLLGAATGMGFAAFETMGYAFRFLMTSGGSLDLLGRVLLTRGVLSPLGHATWSALAVGVFLREGRRVTPASALAFGSAVVLHAAWNWTSGLIPVELALPGVDLRWRFVDLAVPELSLPIPALLVGAVGIWVLRQVGRRRTPPTPTA